MLTKKRYSIKDMARWTRWESLLFFAFATLVTVGYNIFGFTFLNVPWTPVALIGTAVAFMIGFQNNSAYGRIWEARKIWGGIVNASRSWGMKTKDMVTNEYTEIPVDKEELEEHKKVLVHRHIAWLTALRHAMRQPRKWEVFEESHTNREWANVIHIQEKENTLSDELTEHISPSEKAYVLEKKNVPAALLYLQSTHLRSLKERGLVWEFSFLELENLLQEFFTLQGKSERIKNFPYPRQYATLSYVFVWIFLILLPFGIVPEFAKIALSLNESFPVLAPYFGWVAIPFCVSVSWVFHTMERIGRVGENPFEGSANDVPISTISRGIEIDLRQLMDEDPQTIPEPFPEQHNVQM
ncbi:bestrophin family protein [Spongiimicrobium sp. 3-5]|uniref:bestrophin family protein n=1 Tax=Spongiimicrobium sp. 3-5 TaxID=3332596 RepID=UPI00397FD94F